MILCVDNRLVPLALQAERQSLQDRIMHIPYNRLPVTGQELRYIEDAISRRHLSGDGIYTKKCQAWLDTLIGGTSRLTHSCTAALEMSAILSRVGPGDEVIMPSFTFVSTANAFVLRGAVPVFVDIDPETLNIDPLRIEEALTNRTKAIVVVHYAGVCAEMNAIQEIADRHGLIVIEDAAQALFSTYCGRQAGSLGDLACFSFHETKNIVSGEGGAIVINDTSLVERADIIREKGTNRTAFRHGAVDKYTWVDIGSSYLPSELIAAFLLAQLDVGMEITRARMALWDRYHQAFAHLESSGSIRRPIVPQHCGHNGHIYYILLRDLSDRNRVIDRLAEDGILAPFHYIPLHSAPAGKTYGVSRGPMVNTDNASERLLRLPLFVGLEENQDYVIDRVLSYTA